MNMYKHRNKMFISKYEYNFETASDADIINYPGTIFVLTKIDSGCSRTHFKVSSPSQLFIEKEDLGLINNCACTIPKWLEDAVLSGRVMSINTSCSNWEKLIEGQTLKGANVVTVTGLGDVGGILTSGLRLLGTGTISKINIFDKDINKLRRWELECNSILPGDNNLNYPEIACIDEKNIFNCDMFVFCVSTGVPQVGKEAQDVRLAQLKGNSKIISYYARAARENNFKGIFAVVSDPVDLLCHTAYIESNRNKNGKIDYLGLMPDQIKGYGLGVMYARAAYYSRDINEHNKFLNEGRAFGPHGEGLVIADSIINYNEPSSLYLTEKSRSSNMDVRAAGFKPYIAPALSSGSLSLIATLKGEWHYSTNYMGGVYFGCRNRETILGIEFEVCTIPELLYKKLQCTYDNLKKYCCNREV